MNDVFLDKLVQTNISGNLEKTKERVQELWTNADKKSKQELIVNAGQAMYGTISKIIKKGRITAKMAILLSRYLNINPLYLIGKSDDRVDYNEDLLKEFLIKLGYKQLWNEYSKHLKSINKLNDKNIVNENNHDEEVINETPTNIVEPTDEEKHNIEIQFDNYIKDVLNETADEYKKEKPSLSISSDIVDTNEIADISAETLNIMNKLTEEEIITLLRALLIRAKVPNSNGQKLSDKIKLDLLLN